MLLTIFHDTSLILVTLITLNASFYSLSSPVLNLNFAFYHHSLLHHIHLFLIKGPDILQESFIPEFVQCSRQDMERQMLSILIQPV